ncbi:hypothetical protein U2A4042170041 [Corynebacterium striatum]|nr:hypothetical protein U2A4042170041 [Corynebacterium striatum]
MKEPNIMESMTNDIQDQALEDAIEAHKAVEDLKLRLQELKNQRTMAVRRAKTAGVPMGTISKALGISPTMATLIYKNER